MLAAIVSVLAYTLPGWAVFLILVLLFALVVAFYVLAFVLFRHILADSAYKEAIRKVGSLGDGIMDILFKRKKLELLDQTEVYLVIRAGVLWCAVGAVAISAMGLVALLIIWSGIP